MSSITILKCDMCTSEDDVTCVTAPCVFTTEQTEGRSVGPYLTQSKMDLCKTCMDILITNQPLYANGAQGYSTFYWNKINENTTTKPNRRTDDSNRDTAKA